MAEAHVARVAGEKASRSNRLPFLAVEIAEAHEQCRRTIGDVARSAVIAGRGLLEAKQLVPHGAWEGWLHANIPSVSKRTVQLYESGAQPVPKTIELACEALTRGVREYTGPEAQAS